MSATSYRPPRSRSGTWLSAWEFRATTRHRGFCNLRSAMVRSEFAEDAKHEGFCVLRQIGSWRVFLGPNSNDLVCERKQIWSSVLMKNCEMPKRKCEMQEKHF